MDLKSFITVVIIINSVACITSANAADEILSCNHDSDCSVHQYCYQVSNQCVNYTSCIRWNRLEGKKQAQSASQCGPCIPGYQAEILVTGIPEAFCKKVTHIKKESTDVPYSNAGKLSIWIYIAVGIILLLLVVLFSILLVKKRGYIHGNKKWFRQIGSWNFSPTAPPPDGAIYLPTKYYADDEPPIYSSVINNNNNNKDKNRLVRAVPCHPPDWVDNDPNYGHDDPDTSANTTTSTTTNVFTSLQVEDEDTTPSVWTPEEVTVQVPARAFHQFGTEQRDNVLNTVLVRGECSSNSETSEETGPTPSAQTSNSRNNNDNYRGPSVQINQMITLNMVNNDN